MWRQGRWLRIADGPDEVHKMVIAIRELNRFKPREGEPQRGENTPPFATPRTAAASPRA